VSRVVSVLVLVILCANLSYQRGTIYLNQIESIPDAISGITQIPIECTLWDDTTLYLDNLNGIPTPGTGGGSGVEIDGALLEGSTWVFPNELVVLENVIVGGLLQPDGGFIADDGGEGDNNGDGLDYAFEVADNTGDTTVAGTLHILNGLSNQDDITNPLSTFTVDGDTGITTISGLLSPNGGIVILDGVFSVSSDGVTVGDGDLTVEGNLYFGNQLGSRAYITLFSNFFPPIPLDGGDFTLQGQDATDFGGSLVFSPGFAIGASTLAAPGQIFLGVRNENYTLTISRQPTSDGDAGSLIIGGQQSTANGGAVQIQAGSSDQGPGAGGSLVLVPGQGENGFGTIFLGDPNDGPNIPFVMIRPDVQNSEHASDTYFFWSRYI